MIKDIEEHIVSVLKPGTYTMTKRPKYEFSGEHTKELVDALGHEPTKKEEQIWNTY